MRGSRMVFLLCLVMLLGLSGCARTLNLFSGNDPDGDFDAKGAIHFPMTRAATGKRVFVFDPKYNAWAVYDEDGNRVNTGRATGGKLYCPDIGRACRTVTGTYRILSKGDSRCISSKYPVATQGGAPMPYCMLFHPKGYAIHGTAVVPDYLNSHGCIGVTPQAAKWLNQDFLKIGSTVIVLPY